MTDAPVDYANDPGEFVKAHGLERDTDVQIVTVEEGGKYSEGRFD